MIPQPGNSLRPSRRILGGILSSHLLLLTIVLFVGGLGVGIWKLFFSPNEATKGLAALNAAHSAVRPVESRISGLSYAQFSTQRAQNTDQRKEAEQRRAELILLDARVKQPTPEVFHALGQFYITQRDFDNAIRELEQAVNTTSTNAVLLSDLGVAWLEKGKRDLHKDRPDDPNAGSSLEALGKSLTYLNKALTQDSNLPAGIFNRALCFEYLLLPDRAQQEWQHYLQNDSTSPWAGEARDRLKLLQEQHASSSQTNDQLLASFLTAYESRDDDKAWQLISVTRDDLSGTSISQQLLDTYLDSSISHKTDDANHILQALTYVGELESTRGQEHYTRDLAAVCKSLTPQQKAALVRARGLMKTGFKKYEGSAEAKEMLDVFQEAEKAFEEAGDRVEVHHAKFWTAYILLQSSKDTKRSLAQLTELAERCAKNSYRWLLMRTTQSISSAKYNLKEYSKSLEYSLKALALAEQVGDKIGEFNALDVLTEVFRVINNQKQSLNSIIRSQRLMGCCAFNPIKVWRHYGIVAVGFYSAGLYDAAVEYQQEALRRALDSGDTSMTCVSYAHLGLMYGKLGDSAEALKNARLGYEIAARHAEESKDRGMLAYLSLQLGHLYREANDCENALKNYDQSISIYDSLKFPTHVFQAHKGRLVCYIKEKNDALAQSELQATLAIIEGNRSTILEDENRNKFFDVEQSIYDLAIDYVFEKGQNGGEAFQYTEASRARSLLDHIQGRNIDTASLTPEGKQVFDPLPLAEIKKRLPPENQIVEYTVLEDKTLIWIIDRDISEVSVARISRADLETRVRSYLQSVTDRNHSLEDINKQAKELFALLIQPIEPWLDKQKQLNIVPDKILNAVPFPSLVSPASGRLLIEDYSVSYAPSATVLVLVSTEAGTIDPKRPEKMLAVGNPRLENDRYQSLPNLKEAEREAQQIWKLYQRGNTLMGPAATKQRVLAELIDSDVAHFAVHAIEEEQDEMHSRLVLAKGQAKSGNGIDDLEAREIYQLKLAKTRLAVLSACQTGSGRYYAGEGTLSLARAFLVSGVPVVVSSLWPVDSQATAELMINFHKIRKQGFSTAEALRRAQLQMIGSSQSRFRHPYYWSPFSVMGGCERSSQKITHHAK